MLNIQEIANKQWKQKNTNFDLKIVKTIYDSLSNTPEIIPVLQETNCLENYLWPNLTFDSEKLHFLTIIKIINSLKWLPRSIPLNKFMIFVIVIIRDYLADDNKNINIIDKIEIIQFFIKCFSEPDNETISSIVLRLVSLPNWIVLSENELLNEFEQSKELSISWKKLNRIWNKTKKIKKTKKNMVRIELLEVSKNFLSIIFQQYFQILNQLSKIIEQENNEEMNILIKYLYSMVQLFFSFLTRLSLRRFFLPVFKHYRLIEKTYLSKMFLLKGNSNTKLNNLKNLIKYLDNYEEYPINSHTGKMKLKENLMVEKEQGIFFLQKTAFHHFPQVLKSLILDSVSNTMKPKILEKYLNNLSLDQILNLMKLSMDLQNIQNDNNSNNSNNNNNNNNNNQNDDLNKEKSLIIKILKRQFSKNKWLNNKKPNFFFPKSFIIMENGKIKFKKNMNLQCPELSLQYLSYHDFFYRNFNFLIKNHNLKLISELENIFKKSSKKELFTPGKSIINLLKSEIIAVEKPELGSKIPNNVRCNIYFDLFENFKILQEIDPQKELKYRKYWDKTPIGTGVILLKYKKDKSNPSQYIVSNLHLGTVIKETKSIKLNKKKKTNNNNDNGDSNNSNEINNENTENNVGDDFSNTRVLEIELDPEQYQKNLKVNKLNIYKEFNVIIKRDLLLNSIITNYGKTGKKKLQSNYEIQLIKLAKKLTNNSFTLFKTIELPKWLNDLFLGYGEFDSLFKLLLKKKEIPLYDSLIDENQIKNIFNNNLILKKNNELKIPKFSIFKNTKNYKFVISKKNNNTEKHDDDNDEEDNNNNNQENERKRKNKNNLLNEEEKYQFIIEEITENNLFTKNYNNHNFTQNQILAIICSNLPGLLLINGPYGTGKKTVLSQIVSNFYKNQLLKYKTNDLNKENNSNKNNDLNKNVNINNNKKIFIVTKTKNELENIFKKLNILGIEYRHLLKLQDWEYENENSQTPNSLKNLLDHSLIRRIALLKQVSKLGKILNVGENVGYTCETANYFFKTVVQYHYNKFLTITPNTGESVKDSFPFVDFFKKSSIEELFVNKFEQDFNVAKELYNTQILPVFMELNEHLLLEQLQSTSSRFHFFTFKQAKIIGTTFDFIVEHFEDFKKNHFRFNTLILSEATNFLDLELLTILQINQKQKNIEKIIMFGDLSTENGLHEFNNFINHKDDRYYNYSEGAYISTFRRFSRLGANLINFNTQWRINSSIVDLFQSHFLNNFKQLELNNNNLLLKKFLNLEKINTKGNNMKSKINNLLVKNDKKKQRINQKIVSLKDLETTFGEDLNNPGLLYNFQIINVDKYQNLGQEQIGNNDYINYAEAEYIVSVYQYLRFLKYPSNVIKILTPYNSQKRLILKILKQKCSWSKIFNDNYCVSTFDEFQGNYAPIVLISLVKTNENENLISVEQFTNICLHSCFGCYVFCYRKLLEKNVRFHFIFNQLQKKNMASQKLILVLDETFDKTQRKLNQNPKNSEAIFEVDNMIIMSNVIYQFSKTFANNNKKFIQIEIN
ncbi:RNA helicase aquarius [Anaeramoeba flamelloides]|uniref:RNA helicase aquarius n=1 Tax=Anaeramoeba flamelloides TaxID=1746091 RepID=A0AAV8AC98_9EUKA|nr:RNA helicase aquarius [Anaeramoeba flamelloides]